MSRLPAQIGAVRRTPARGGEVRPGALLAFFLLAACATAPAAPEPPALRELIWTDPSADVAYALTHQPGECLARRAPEIEAGRALFMSRTLLGGPAARVGLSCASCHINGRANAHFLLPELTNVAGHADVTSEWSSRVRGDGVDNPIPIPDLAGLSARAHFGRSREPSLAKFVRDVIVDEFQGPEPSAGVQAALLAYLASLDARACAGPAQVRIAGLAEDVRRAFAAAQGAQEAALRDLLILATQDALARLAERLPAPRFTAERAALGELSGELTRARASGLAPGWLARFDPVAARIERRQAQTWASEAVLRRSLPPQR